MKIAIFSDSHDNINNLKKAILWLKENKIKKIIHCGDICSPDVLKEALLGFDFEVDLCFGNADYDKNYWKKSFEKNPKIKIHRDLGELVFNNKKIGFCHFNDQAKKLAKEGKYDIFFYGHTHKPWEEMIGKCRLVNPGNLSGILYKATFAVYDTSDEKLELKILERI